MGSLSSYVDQPHVDEEILREYHLTLVRHWALLAEDEYPTLVQEEQILSLSPQDLEEQTQPAAPVSKPFKPFILTRNAVQAAVFGAGYPSLPTMTVDQFADEQIRRGVFPAVDSVLPPLNPDETVRRYDPSDAERIADEKKSAEDDTLEDTDDPQYLRRARAMDEFKDEHRRGSGNLSLVDSRAFKLPFRKSFSCTTQDMSRKAKVQYVEGAEPSFIREFKQRAGIGNMPTVDTKKESLLSNTNEDGDRPDEQPQIVLDPNCGVSESEARSFLEQHTVKSLTEENRLTVAQKPSSDAKEPLSPSQAVPGKILYRPTAERTTNDRAKDTMRNKTRYMDESGASSRDRSPLNRKADKSTNKPGLLSFNPEDEDGGYTPPEHRIQEYIDFGSLGSRTTLLILKTGLHLACTYRNGLCIFAYPVARSRQTYL
ncbi:immunoglobulin-binding protein 1 [Clonorchis sinensis]|uniref:Immunoglobulin-binding protein 1 n=1 Tax=Clonorchis sinensis TaxID=79923 RepID=G7YB40_CLOSI|nr:immunoglobulin-binding protein 1 [Clonorchis sinensis]